jgi:plasmid stabilization system protein ParE
MKIVYGKSALKDLEAVRTYIARDNPDAARRVIERIEQAARRLENFPYSGRPGPRGNQASISTRLTLYRDPSRSERHHEDRRDFSYISESAILMNGWSSN